MSTTLPPGSTFKVVTAAAASVRAAGSQRRSIACHRSWPASADPASASNCLACSIRHRLTYW